MDFETAVSVDNVDILHKSIMPLLPAGTEANPEVLTYYLFKLNNGARKIFALEWITESSIVSVTQMIVNFKILVNSSADIKNIKESLNKLGLYSYEAMVL